MRLKGVSVSAGFAIGRAFLYVRNAYAGRESYFNGDSTPYLEDFCRARTAAIAELGAMIDALPLVKEKSVAILVAHQALLEDEEIIGSITELIEADHAMPEYAVEKAMTKFADMLAAVDDPLIASRVADLLDIKNRLLRNLRGEKGLILPHPNEKVILVAHDLLPSDTATMNPDQILGIITEIGSETSHSAIIARSLNIPALIGVSKAMDSLKNGMTIALNAIEGIVIIEPTIEEIAQLQKENVAFEAKRIYEEKFRNAQSLTKDCTKIDIGVNIGSDDEYFDPNYDFIGLFRTEFLYMRQDHLPTEAEQYQVYRKILQRAAGKPVILRTLDIGGDKTLPYLELPKEENPFLGKRALRLCLERTDLFKTQLRAALRASNAGQLWLMFPMVGSMDDIRRIKDIIIAVKNDLRTEHIPFDEETKFGIMIEIPSIALISDLVVKEVDFASIGTNDLCQYTLAVDRMNLELHDYYQSLSPAMLRIMRTAISAFTAANKPISVCGELAGEPIAAAALLGLGIRKLSMSYPNIPRVKAALSKITIAEATKVVSRAINCQTEAEVRKELAALIK